MSIFAVVLALGVMSCDPNENSITPDNSLEEYIETYTQTSSMCCTDETSPINPPFDTGNDFDQSWKHFVFILNADGTAFAVNPKYTGSHNPQLATWDLRGKNILIKYYGTVYNLNVTSLTDSGLVATYSDNLNI